MYEKSCGVIKKVKLENNVRSSDNYIPSTSQPCEHNERRMVQLVVIRGLKFKLCDVLKRNDYVNALSTWQR